MLKAFKARRSSYLQSYESDAGEPPLEALCLLADATVRKFPTQWSKETGLREERKRLCGSVAPRVQYSRGGNDEKSRT